MCVCTRLGQPGAIGGVLGCSGRRDEAREGWRDRRSAGVSLGKVQVWADSQKKGGKESWVGEVGRREQEVEVGRGPKADGRIKI